jgi:hypothetical protein
MMRHCFYTYALLTFALISLFSITASAQFRAGVQGTVTDSAGGAIAGATVTLTNKETNQTQTTTTSDAGFYRFSELAPGLYSISVEQQGFKKRIVDDVKIAAESITGQDIALEAGGINETVTVQSNEVTLDNEDANIRKTITNDEILQLPQVGRDPYELARLTPGVFGTGARNSDGTSSLLPNTSGPGASNVGIFATENRQPISANGQRVSSNNYQIDGSSVNSQTWGGGAVITPSQESVKEVQVTSSTYSAEDGRNSGAQIKVVSQNGTNDWHGSAFYKIDDPSLNAFNRMPFNNTPGLTPTAPTRVEQKYRNYGGSFGGPLPFPRFGEVDSNDPEFRSGKNRLFFFFAYEGLTNSSNNVNQTPVYIETAAYRSSVLAARPGSLAAAFLSDPGITPRVVQVLTPSCADLSGDISNGCAVVSGGLDVGSLTGATGQYVHFFNTGGAPVGGGLDHIADLQKVLIAVPQKFTGNQFNTRIDLDATKTDHFTFSSYFVPNTATTADATAASRPMADIISKRFSYALGFIYNHTFSSNVVNEARFNITRWGFDETTSNPQANFGIPRIEIESIMNTGDRIRMGAAWGQNTPGQINEKQWELRDILTDVMGNHALKFGGEYRRDLNKNSEIGFARPLFTFKGLWNFANDTPIFEQIVADPTGKPVPNNATFHTGDLGLFAQDDWKFHRDLTLNLGLRWEWFSPITVDEGQIGNLLLGPAGGLTGATITTRRNLTNNNFKNFAPQLGFAWNPKMFGEKMVLRGGGGIGYDRLPNALLANARRNPPNGSIYSFCCGTNGTTDGFGTPFDSGFILYAPSTTGGITGFPRNPLVGGGLNSAGLPNSGGVEIYGAPQDMPDATIYRYSLEGQYQLPDHLIGTLGYQGSLGRHFVRINPIFITTPGTNPAVGAVYFASPDVNSNYNAMIARLQGRFMRQFSFDTNYRFAKSIDTASFESPCACTNQSYPVDQREERGPSDFDVRHSFVAAGTWDLPIFENRKSWTGRLLGGWQISSIVTWNSGFPWTPKIFGCLQLPTSQGGFCDLRPTSYNGTQPASNSNANFLRNTGLFGVPGTSIFGTNIVGGDPFAAVNRPAIGRNVFRGPRYFNTDMAFAKKFGLGNWGVLGESPSLDIRFNFFNIFNNLNLAPFGSNSNPTRVQLSDFGRGITALAGRVGEFQARFSF